MQHWQCSELQQPPLQAVQEGHGGGRHAQAWRVHHDRLQQGEEVDHLLLVKYFDQTDFQAL